MNQPLVVGVIRDGDWQLAQHLPASVSRSNDSGIALMIVLLFLVVLPKRRKVTVSDS
jgi:hypothetical protein